LQGGRGLARAPAARTSGVAPDAGELPASSRRDNLLLPSTAGVSFNDFDGTLQNTCMAAAAIACSLLELPGSLRIRCSRHRQTEPGRPHESEISLLLPSASSGATSRTGPPRISSRGGDTIYDTQGEQLTWGDNDATDDYQLRGATR